MTSLEIRQDDLTGPEIAALLQEHLDEMYRITPPESVHALDLKELRQPSVTFWSAWLDGELVGCGALKEMDACSAEIKSMRTSLGHRGRRVGSRVLEHILETAAARGYSRLYLETGSQEEFAPARGLYERYGFGYRGPFGDYVEDPNSVFMTRRLAPEGVCVRQGR
ncbi:MAG: GNAT family N-acetyltransferase [Acidobacteriota bacterium]|nr:GNAT family N-acetyltransferase [Acidobacteriota bacterium]